MISFHRNTRDFGHAYAYAHGFEVADTEDVNRIAKGIVQFPWSGCVWRDGKRQQDNFLSAIWCVLDFDNGLTTLDQALKTFCDAVHIIGVTKSHRKEKQGITCDRFRVVLKFEETITTLKRYRASMCHYLDNHDADPACKDGARFFWPCKEVVSTQAEGYLQQVFDPQEREARDYALYRKTKFIPRWIEGILRFGCPEFTKNTTCFKLGLYLTRCGFQRGEIIDLVMKSPVPVGPEVRAEVEKAVSSGIASALAESE